MQKPRLYFEREKTVNSTLVYLQAKNVLVDIQEINKIYQVRVVEKSRHWLKGKISSRFH